MALLLWDQVGERVYESGIDRGVLYLPDGGAVPWNGLISVSEKPSASEGTPVYFDGVKYSDSINLLDFSATIKAYTYPNEFLQFEGIIDAGNGLYVANQRPSRFGLSYRTKIGNDVNGEDFGYKIHVIYNLTAFPSQKSYQTISDASITEFEWSVTAVPDEISGFRASAHIIFDTRYMGALLIEDLESALYGDALEDPRLPAISTLVNFISNWVIIRITDNLNGTWTATGPDNLVSMLDSTTFQITQANAAYLDVDTYMISDLTY